MLKTKITGPGQRGSLSVILGEGKRAVTVRVDDVRGVAGFILPGDFVERRTRPGPGGGLMSAALKIGPDMTVKLYRGQKRHVP
jgi:pilus assembly protein CpaB